MNVPFTLEKSGLGAEFIKEAAKENMVQLKRHKSVGGMRASIYNAMPLAAVEKLVAFMKDFQSRLKMKHLLGRIYKKNWMSSNYDMKD
nr:phosphoserine aminotransferase 2, chloroplastic-like [Quercus suber]POE45405.1 phosphoserine aminotransferase 2, chloroplastic [Quercus suber]